MVSTTATDPVVPSSRTLSAVALAVAPLVAVLFAIATPFVVPDSPVAPDEAVMHLPLTAMFGAGYGYGAMLLVGVPVAIVLRRVTKAFGPTYVLAGLLTGAIAGLLSGWSGPMIVWGSVAGATTGLAFLGLNVGMAPDADPPGC